MTSIDRDKLTQTLAEIVRIPSINPDLNPGASGEAELANAIAERLRRTPGIDVELQDAGNGRPNVIATVGRGEGRTLMLNGHLDTVGVAGMDDPFSGAVDGNRLYGRGAFDMKNAVAGVIVLLEALAGDESFAGKLVATFVVDEEYASIGTQAICREIDRWKPDAALIMEPTGLEIDVAHKGFVWATITTRGRAEHGSRFEDGIDAISHMGRVIVRLEQLSNELVNRTPHEIVGPPSMHASTIRGGQELSSYPDTCVLEIERRTIPGETAQQVEAEFQQILDDLATQDPQFQATLEMGLVRDPFEISRDAEIVQTVRQQVMNHTGSDPKITGGAGWMDSALLAAAGVPTTIIGPGGDGAHALIEWADLDVLYDFTVILENIAREFCKG